MKNSLSNFKNWIKSHPKESIFIFLILILACFLRFYKLDQYMTFLGDEGRDALMVERILVRHDFPLLGPPTSVGNMYLGPLYYYMMSLAMLVFWLNPVAAAGMIATIGVLTIALIYFLTRKFFGVYAAVVASVAYTISPVTIIYSRSSWNPNPESFFALLCLLGLYFLKQTNNFLWLILVGASLAFALQMHYLALLLIPILGIIFFYTIKIKNKKERHQNLYKGLIFSILIFFFLMSPLLIFDFKYNFLNLHAFLNIIHGQNSPVQFNILATLIRVFPIYQYNLISRYLAGENLIISLIFSILIALPLIHALRRKINHQPISWPILTIAVWLILGILGLAFYRDSIYDHYLGFLNPVSFILLGASINFFQKSFQFVAMIIILLILMLVNIPKNPLFTPPNNQLQRTQEIAKYVISESQNKPFNFALISGHNYDAAYQFYFEQYNHKPAVVPVEITDQLFVVCEDPVCKPINNPKYEIAGFGLAKIADETSVLGVKVFKLVANPGGKP
ncbi:glycosyltransferase family 39 protein [Candidatus Daviesbacteria bacterium]|nr:glycosyltransferase family 39 protein [Candidatus Daviesbacteria bacterium]